MHTKMKPWKTLFFATGMTVAIASGLSAAESHHSLYDRLGGMPAVRAVVDDFVAHVLTDDRINQWFAHAASTPETAAAYKGKLADFICQAAGGPCHYAGADMVSAHRGRGITEEAFNAVVEDLRGTLDRLRVPEKEQSDLLNLLAPLKSAVVQKNQQ